MHAVTFLFLVVLPIWGAAELIARWIESSAEDDEEKMLESLVERASEMSARIAALEGVLREEKPDSKNGTT
jgi:phage shock protein B